MDAITVSSGTSSLLTTNSTVPAAWVQLGGRVRVPDYQAGIIPAPPTSGLPAGTAVTFCLLPPDGVKAQSAYGSGLTEDDAPGLRITSYIAPFALCAPFWTDALRVDLADHHVLTVPTTYALGVYAHGETWPDALQALAAGYAQLGQFVDTRSVDWTRVATVAALGAAAGLRPGRDYATTAALGDIFQSEAALAGASVVSYRGRLAIGRLAEAAVSEVPTAIIRRAAYLPDQGNPQQTEASRGLVGKFTVDTGSSHGTITITDPTSVQAYGPGTAEAQVTLPRGAIDNGTSSDGLLAALIGAAGTCTGAYRRPYDVVTFQLPLTYGDVEVSDVVRIADDWLIPQGDGTRGLVGRAAVVVGRKLRLFADGHLGMVTLSVRLGDPSLAGYAPAALVTTVVASVLTLDTATFGPAGLSPTAADTDGGASWFGRVPGAVVRLTEIDNATPHADETRTVASVTGDALTLDASPDAAWAAIAAAGRMMVRYADYPETLAAQHAEGYAWECDRATSLLGGTAQPARYAA